MPCTADCNIFCKSTIVESEASLYETQIIPNSSPVSHSLGWPRSWNSLTWYLSHWHLTMNFATTMWKLQLESPNAQPENYEKHEKRNSTTLSIFFLILWIQNFTQHQVILNFVSHRTHLHAKMTLPFKMKICLILHQAMQFTSYSCHYTLDICPLKCLLHT